MACRTLSTLIGLGTFADGRTGLGLVIFGFTLPLVAAAVVDPLQEGVE